MIDPSLFITIGLIFIVSLFGAWMRSRRKDPCLAGFEGFHVTLELDNERLVWGELQVTPTGLELDYQRAIRDDQHIETSYVLYGKEYGNIQAIFRYADELSPEKKSERDKAIRRAFHPGPLRYFARRFRNFMSTATESFNEVIGVLIGRAKKPGGRFITDTSEGSLKRFGAEVVGHVGGVHDPLLERFIGCRVVVEMLENGEIHEHVGIFKNYSADFLEILDVQFPFRMSLEVEPEREAKTNVLVATIVDGAVEITNTGEQPLLVSGWDTGNGEEPLNIVLENDITIPLFPENPVSQAKIFYRAIRELDMVVPRTLCVVRHRAENAAGTLLTDIIFDVGLLLSAGRREQIHETRLRRKLQLDDNDATAAANLGELLLKKRGFAEAEQWLKHALERANSLPDNGRRVHMQLRELERRRKQGFVTTAAEESPAISEVAETQRQARP